MCGVLWSGASPGLVPQNHAVFPMVTAWPQPLLRFQKLAEATGIMAAAREAVV